MKTAGKPSSRENAPSTRADVAAPRAPGERFRTPTRLVGTIAKIESRKSLIILSGLSLLMCCLMFPRPGWWWLSYICLTPWLIAVCAARRARSMYFASWLLGLGFFFININWMYPVTREGYLALGAFFSLSFPLVAWPVRHLYMRHNVSLALSVPVVWTALEYARSLGPTGFPWVLLGHTHYEQLTFIQISDLAGAYAVSFVLAMINGWITDLLIQPILIWRSQQGTRLPIGSLTTLIVVGGTLIYGSAQRSTRHLQRGPRVALVQHDFPMYVDERRARSTVETIFDCHLELAKQAALGGPDGRDKPDLIVLPETVMSGWINDEFLDAPPTALEEIIRRRYPRRQVAMLRYYQDFGKRVREAFQTLADQSGIPIVLGSSAMEWKPTAIPPRADSFNSAYLLLPGQKRPAARYDKIHLVLFGEYVPFRFTHRWLYDFLNGMTPWGRGGVEYSLSPGEQFNAFEIPVVSAAPPATSLDSTSVPTSAPIESASQIRTYRAGTPICYEEIMPYVPRAFVRGGSTGEKYIDMLLTISNDGWFLHSAELEQHLAAAVFRAVENRIAVARSVNTGASATIHPNGRIHMRVRISDEKLARLDALDRALIAVGEHLDKMERLADTTAGTADAKEYTSAWSQLNILISKELLAACLSVGPEMKSFHARLASMFPDLIRRDPAARAAAYEDWRDQLALDRETIERWKRHPDQAPGIGVGELKLDNRLTLYSQWGDWLGQGALALYGMIVLDWLLRRLRRQRA